VIEDSCFINNDFIGFGVIRANGGSAITVSGNAGTNDDDLFCQFVATSDLLNPTVETEVTCIEYELAVCPLLSVPTKTPTPMPSPAPTTSASASESAQNDTSSAVATKRLGAALALMAVTISFFGFF
jgi:hypothetical protein